MQHGSDTLFRALVADAVDGASFLTGWELSKSAATSVCFRPDIRWAKLPAATSSCRFPNLIAIMANPTISPGRKLG